MKEKHLLTKITQKAILKKGSAVLLVLDNRDMWELPGGRLHVGETVQDGLMREIKEEVGLEVTIINIHDVFTMQTNDVNTKLVITYNCTFDSNIPITPQETEVFDYKWVAKEDLDELPIYPEYKRILASVL